MAAKSVGVFTGNFPDSNTLSTPHSNRKFLTLTANHSFQYPISNSIRTLSTHGVSDGGDDPYGILYVPDLQTDYCRNKESSHVPQNATRIQDLPTNTNYPLIAVAPWLVGQPQCMQEYFESARKQQTQALLVYQPGSSAQMPPPMQDESWGLEDGGNWKSDNPFPAYALSPISGTIVMHQLSLYSGNITQVPDGAELSTVFQPTDYIRLWAIIDLESKNHLPSLWVFLVIVLALLLSIIGATSISMHVVQRRRREDLRERVLRGEVDLEALGIKRLTVPKPLLDKMPVYVYTKPLETTESKETVFSASIPGVSVKSLSAIDPEAGLKAAESSLRPASSPSLGISPAFTQPTCAICLEDFEQNVSEIRELPCRHIFHPECVDTFLLRNSSLCPMCKTSTLPPGCCPTKITNTMVRRERIIQRMQDRNHTNRNLINAGRSTVAPPAAAPTAAPESVRSRIWRILMDTRRVFGSPQPPGPPQSTMEMVGTATLLPAPVTTPSQRLRREITNATTVTAPSANEGSLEPRPDCLPTPTVSTTQNHREWARQQAMMLLGRGNAAVPVTEPADETESVTDRIPAWRRLIRKTFPGYS